MWTLEQLLSSPTIASRLKKGTYPIATMASRCRTDIASGDRRTDAVTARFTSGWASVSIDMAGGSFHE